MIYKERIPKDLIKDNHFLGRPADFNDKIVKRRIRILRSHKDFCGRQYDLLDIGCGNGASMFLLHKDMKNCLGIDIEKTHKYSFEVIKNKFNVENCSYEIFDIEKNDLQKKFDRIISFEVIEHLRNEKSVKKYFDLLKEEGLIAITVPNKWWIFETHGAKLPLLPWNRVPFFSWLPTFIHERFANARIYNKKRIVKLMESSGFNVIDIKYVTAPLDVLKDSGFKRFLEKFIFNSDQTNLPFIATSIFLLASRQKEL